MPKILSGQPLGKIGRRRHEAPDILGCQGQFYLPPASFIAMRCYCASHSVIRFASFEANKITLNPQDSITLLSEDNNITLP